MEEQVDFPRSLTGCPVSDTENTVKNQEVCNNIHNVESSVSKSTINGLPECDGLGKMSIVTAPEVQESRGESVQVDMNNTTNTVSHCVTGDKDLKDTVGNYQTVDPMVRIKMLARVSLSDAHFRHQQRGDPDLTEDEKIEIAQTVLDESKAKFLSRFGNHLELEDLEFFQSCMDDYEVNFYVNQIRKNKASKYQRNKVKNRRFEAMKGLMDKGEYFSEDEMKFREPYLYEQMIGQYLTDDELYAKVDKSDLRFSTILLKHIDQLDENARFSYSKDKEEGQEEEEENSDDSDDEEEMETADGKDPEEKKEKISASEKQDLRDEFLSIMQHKFLEGKDKAFDYSSVDNNEAYDDLTVLNQEAEEKYFDED